MRRLYNVAGLVLLISASAIGPAHAEDLGDYLADADDAIYSGRRFVGTTWDGIVSSEIVEVQHHGGMSMVGSGPTSATVGEGRWHRDDTDEEGFSYVGQSVPAPTDRYTLVPGGPAEHLGRPSHVLDVLERGVLRMRLVVDDSTSAPVLTEVYTADGSVFRSTSMIEFSVSVDAGMAGERDRAYRMLVPLNETDFPAVAAGYRLIDAYEAPEGSSQAFYSDGLFTFSLFATSGNVDWMDVAGDIHTYAAGGRAYFRAVRPATVWILWNAPGRALALVGDLPPDHLEAVLAELPPPGAEHWMQRLWHRIFG
jgi:hypothetical protein